MKSMDALNFLNIRARHGQDPARLKGIVTALNFLNIREAEPA